MSRTFGYEATIELSKSSMASDEDAVNALREAYEAIEFDGEDAVTLHDLGGDACQLWLCFYIDERSNHSAEAAGNLIDVLAPHARRAFRVSGENDDHGRFEDVQGPAPEVVDLAIEVGHESAGEALPSTEYAEALAQAMRYAGVERSRAVSHLVSILRTNQDLLPEGLESLVGEALNKVEASAHPG